MKLLHYYCSIFVGLLIIFSFVHPVSAHGDEPRLEISHEFMNPGGVVDVRGVDFEPEESITLMLINPQTAIPLGEIIANVEGVFLITVPLPVDLTEGTYSFLAITDDHNITSPDLTVQGSPIYGGEGGQGLRDEGDPLLAPIPTFAPGVVPGGVVQRTTQPAAPVAEIASGQGSYLIVVILLLAGVLIGFGLRFRQKK